jgi:chemotaxis protein methyltransferase CheR
VLATDISDQMLARADAGRYTQLEVNRGLAAPGLARHFERVDGDWRIREDIRRMVEFRKLNLVTPWPPLPRMDVVFMRNVMIYFGLETRRFILGNVRRCLRPDGYLFLGSAESAARVDDAFAGVVLGKARGYRMVAA